MWNYISRLTFVNRHAPRGLQGYSLKLAGFQILQLSLLCRKLLMDDATPHKGCGRLPPEARITDGQWALPLNAHWPWLEYLLILYQWLCKRCTPIILTDERLYIQYQNYSVGLLSVWHRVGPCFEHGDELIECWSLLGATTWPVMSRWSSSQEKMHWKWSLPWNIPCFVWEFIFSYLYKVSSVSDKLIFCWAYRGENSRCHQGRI